MGRVYLDHNARALPLPAATQAWLAAQAVAWANPSSIHRDGQAARAVLDQARSELAAAWACRAEDLVQTSGGTEAINQVVRAQVGLGARVVILAGEHEAVRESLRSAGAAIELLPVNAGGLARPEDLAQRLGPETRLVCLAPVDGVLGVAQDLPALVAEVRRRAPQARILADCSQAAARLRLRLPDLGVDHVAIAGHKLGAPLGVGVLWTRPGLDCPPLIAGGGQQDGRRSGTEDAAGLAALAAAVRARLSSLEADQDRQGRLLAESWQRLQAARPDLVWLGESSARVAGTCCLACPGADARALVIGLDLAGIAVSQGPACSSAEDKPAAVVAALGLPMVLARAAIRVSTGPETTSQDLLAFERAYVALLPPPLLR